MPPARRFAAESAARLKEEPGESARDGLEELVREQAALRRVATLVAEGAPPAEVFAAVVNEVARILGLERVGMSRYEADGTATVIGATGEHPYPPGSRSALNEPSLLLHVRTTGRPARIDDYRALPGTMAAAAHEAGVRSAIGTPIIVDGRTWGAIIATSTEPRPIPDRSELRLAQFTDLVATAVSNATAHTDLSALADEQAALRRVATLVARGAPAAEIFSAVAEEVGGLLGPDHAVMARFDGPDVVTIMAEWTSTGDPPRLEKGRPLSEGGIAKLVQDSGRTVRVDDYVSAAGNRQSWVLDSGTRAAVAAPIMVDGRLWGVMGVGSRGEPPPSGTEERLAGFIDLVATAIANTQAREELRRVAAEQAALRRVATLVAKEAPAAEVFASVTAEAGRLFDAECGLLRYDPEGTATIVGQTEIAQAPDIWTQLPLGGQNAATLVFETGRPARIDLSADNDSNPLTVIGRPVGQSAVGAPVSVAGRLWGVLILVSERDEPLPAATEARLEGLAELVATAIANAGARAELTASRARVIATADETRRRIERDLHDGVQQRLVSLGLQLRAAQATVPPELVELAGELDGVVTGLTIALDELRDYARGIHPAVLVKGGLAPAMRALARRSVVPVELELHLGARLPQRIELGAYYLISEALTNAAKHADASSVAVSADEAGGVLRLCVRDDGVGGATFVPGSGLVGVKDRVAALGGLLVVESPPGLGTTLRVEIPLSAEDGS